MSKQEDTESGKIDKKKIRKTSVETSVESKFSKLSAELAEAPDSMKNIVLEKIKS
mgnify:FL=1